VQTFCAVHSHGSERVSALGTGIVTAAKMNISASESFIFLQDFLCSDCAAHLFGPDTVSGKPGIVRSRPRAYNVSSGVSIVRADNIFPTITDYIARADKLLLTNLRKEASRISASLFAVF
jgi:hypothetical protein